MAVTHYLGREINTGSQIVWGPSGASGVTHNMDLNAFTMREGNYADLGATWEGVYCIDYVVENGTAPAAGGLYPLWLFCSQTTGDWPSPLTGADATVASPDKYIRQRFGMFTHAVLVTADANTACRQNLKLWRPYGRYVLPVVENWTSTGPRSNGTSVLSRITLTRVRGVIYT